MKIGIDLDGVVIDSETTFRTYEEIFDIDTLKGNNLINKEEPKFQARYNWTNEQEQEFIDNLDSDDFFRRYGNPVKFNADGRYLVAMSFELYERLFGKLDLPDILGEGKEEQNVSSN